MSHRARAIERQIGRLGRPIKVRRSAGSFDVVTSTHTETAALEVETPAVLRRRVQRNTEGGALLAEQEFYLTPTPPFEGLFAPQDSDVVIDGSRSLRVMSVRTRHVGKEPVAYELHVSGA